MNSISIILFSFLLFPQFFFAQDEQPAALLSKEKVSIVEAHIFDKEHGAYPSQLITKEYFNPTGYRSKIEIYSDGDITGHYEYRYVQDSIKVERLTYSADELHSVTKIETRNNGAKVKCVDYDPAGVKTGMASVERYNAKKQLLQMKYFSQGKLNWSKRLKYYDNGNLKETIEKARNKKKRLKTFPPPGFVMKDQFDKKENPKITNTKYDRPVTILGLAGNMDLKKGDEIETRKYFLQNGLLDYELQYLNDEFLAKKKYTYHSNSK